MSQVPQAQQQAPRPIHNRIENEPISTFFMWDIMLLLACSLIGFPFVLFAATFYGR